MEEKVDMEHKKKLYKQLLIKSFPKNLLIEKPYLGSIVFFVVLFVFLAIYRPLDVRASGDLGFYLTMLAYCSIISLTELALALTISHTNCFRPKGNWTILSELLSIVVILTGIGISVYFAGFMLEPADSRWNLATFFDSFSRSMLIGAIPVVLPSLLNIRYAFANETFQSFEQKNNAGEDQRILIHIESKAKKEHLEFYDDEFVYAESSGNYVDFHLQKQDKKEKVIIRNSMSEIEVQLHGFPYFMRTHRAFIVNLNKISSRKGNALGYRLTLTGFENKHVPVSRQNVRKFEEMMS